MSFIQNEIYNINDKIVNLKIFQKNINEKFDTNKKLLDEAFENKIKDLQLNNDEKIIKIQQIEEYLQELHDIDFKITSENEKIISKYSKVNIIIKYYINFT